MPPMFSSLRNGISTDRYAKLLGLPATVTSILLHCQKKRARDIQAANGMESAVKVPNMNLKSESDDDEIDANDIVRTTNSNNNHITESGDVVITQSSSFVLLREIFETLSLRHDICGFVGNDDIESCKILVQISRTTFT